MRFYISFWLLLLCVILGLVVILGAWFGWLTRLFVLGLWCFVIVDCGLSQFRDGFVLVVSCFVVSGFGFGWFDSRLFV